jgi:peptide deformylase
MRANPRCVGLAAPQLGEEVRIVVVDVSEHPRATRHHGLLVLVNPVIKRSSGSEIAREGCLSIPDLTANVKRSMEVTVEASGTDGAIQSIEAEGFEARALQHEMDHLDGILFLDRVANLTTDVFRRKSP